MSAYGRWQEALQALVDGGALPPLDGEQVEALAQAAEPTLCDLARRVQSRTDISAAVAERLAGALERCEKAAVSLDEMADERASVNDLEDAARLRAKASGMTLAVSYLREAIRA